MSTTNIESIAYGSQTDRWFDIQTDKRIDVEGESVTGGQIGRHMVRSRGAYGEITKQAEEPRLMCESPKVYVKKAF